MTTTPDSAPTPAGRPADRYGRPPMDPLRRRRLAIGLGAAVVVLALGGAVLGYQRFEEVDVKGEMNAYRVLDDRDVEVTIGVTRKDPSRPVVCIIRARSRDGAETGRREVLVGPARDRTVQVTATVRSYARPYVGDIYGCGTDIPRYLTGG